ncbi:unnamed protein product [Allacma fusca]|uniref:Carbohydrate kinase PfkB domain-containing protein n=1 Tax=Allacma fusca TaxID=39272 RepID=A0A8J2LA56_9HEXA|nr:unnamed protein product [Allacma fusca]
MFKGTCKSDGRTHRTKIRTVPGGVGRNMAEALQKLGHSPLFISAIGNDLFGREIVRNFKENQMDMAGILTAKSPTAIYSALLNHKGECVFGLGDMTVHCDISSEMLKGHIEDIRRASIVLLDGNIPTETMSTVFEICFRYSVPLWFEPTEIRKAKKILEVPREYWSSLRYISPNLRELMSITALPSSQAEFATLEKGFDNWDKAGDNSSISMNIDMNINEILTAGNFLPTHPTLSHLISHCFSIFTGLEIILLTRGTQGFFVLERDGNSFSAMHFPAPDIHPKDLKSVSGAGDCLNAGFISGLLHQLPLEMCAGRGTHCAKKSLESTSNVPPHFKLANNGHEEDVFVQY